MEILIAYLDPELGPAIFDLLLLPFFFLFLVLTDPLGALTFLLGAVGMALSCFILPIGTLVLIWLVKGLCWCAVEIYRKWAIILLCAFVSTFLIVPLVAGLVDAIVHARLPPLW